MKYFFVNFQTEMLDKVFLIWYNNVCCEILAQPVEHTPFKREVEGSNPSYLTSAASALLDAFGSLRITETPFFAV